MPLALPYVKLNSMKKLLLTFFSLIFFFLLANPGLVYAHHSGTFDCVWNTISKKCNLPRPNNSNNECTASGPIYADLDPVCSQHDGQTFFSNDQNEIQKVACQNQRDTFCDPFEALEQLRGKTVPGFTSTDSQSFSSIDPTCSINGIEGIRTGLGCLPTSPQEFVETIFPWAIGIAGTVALLLIVVGAFTHITAAGNPEKLQKSKEIITSAIAGLIIIIFSAVLLRIIGLEIFGLPGFQ